MDFNDVDTWLSTEGQANPDQYLISQITDTKLLPNTLDEQVLPKIQHI
jgi:hypothetical protein